MVAIRSTCRSNDTDVGWPSTNNLVRVTTIGSGPTVSVDGFFLQLAKATSNNIINKWKYLLLLFMVSLLSLRLIWLARTGWQHVFQLARWG
jgi:hypothetical protein